MKMFSAFRLIVLVSTFGCGSAEPVGERSASATELDSGNLRYSAGDHATALEHYRAAAAADASNAAAWFGIYMANLALGDSRAAAEALQQVERLVPDAAWREHPHDLPRATTPVMVEPAVHEVEAR